MMWTSEVREALGEGRSPDDFLITAAPPLPRDCRIKVTRLTRGARPTLASFQNTCWARALPARCGAPSAPHKEGPADAPSQV